MRILVSFGKLNISVLGATSAEVQSNHIYVWVQFIGSENIRCKCWYLSIHTMVTTGGGSRSKFHRDSHYPRSSGGKCKNTCIKDDVLVACTWYFQKGRMSCALRRIVKNF